MIESDAQATTATSPPRGKRAPPFKKGDPSANPHGRPRKTLTKKQLELVTRLAARALPDRDIAASVGMSVPTFINAKRDFPDLEEALRSGRQRIHDLVANGLLAKCKKGDVIALIYCSKALLGWSDRGAEEGGTQVTINMIGAASGADLIEGQLIEDDDSQDHLLNVRPNPPLITHVVEAQPTTSNDGPPPPGDDPRRLPPNGQDGRCYPTNSGKGRLRDRASHDQIDAAIASLSKRTR